MPTQKITPEKVTKPIQLLAAWLTGLVIVDGAFLATAINFGTTTWMSGTLVVASVVNVPLFLFSIFLLQTKFRPEMQEDQFYSKYLDKRISLETGKLQNEALTSYNSQFDGLKTNIHQIEEKLESLSHEISDDKARKVVEELTDVAHGISSTFILKDAEVEINDLLPDYSKICDSLKEHNISISNTFGSSSVEPEVPELLILTYGRDANIETFRATLTLLREFGELYVSYADHLINEGKIYIGSYAYRSKESNYKKVNDNLFQLLTDPHLTSSKIKYLLTT